MNPCSLQKFGCALEHVAADGQSQITDQNLRDCFFLLREVRVDDVFGECMDLDAKFSLAMIRNCV
jgi:hypothetical protein